MSIETAQLFGGSQGSRWLTNQAVSSAAMIERMITEELRRGDFSALDARVGRIEELVSEHVLESDHERRLLLLEALFLEGAGETRGAYRIAGRLLADKERLEQGFLSGLRRFRARLALNRGDIAEARAEVTLTERVVMETLRGLGEISEVIDHEDLSKVTAATWLLSAEISLAEGEFEKALQDLANARGCVLKSADEAAMFELLSALVCVGMGDSGGAPALAYLYELHVALRDESSVDAITSARIAAAAGDMGQVVGISESEALRWRKYGPDPEIVKHYLREGSGASVPGALLERLPLPHELIAAMDESLVDTRVRVEGDLGRTGGLDGNGFALLPMSFLFEFFRLEEVTGMFDFNLKTGHMVVDWSGCEEALLREAVQVGAISELVLRCKGGTIYLNNGSYVDASLDSADSDLQNMPAVDVIFELFRISTAGLPGSGARQFNGGPECARVPEVINLRPNKFNLDLTKRLDNMRSGRTDEEPEEELDLDAAFANWGSGGTGSQNMMSDVDGLEANVSVGTEESSEVAGEEFSSVAQWAGLPCLLGMVEAEEIVALELSVVECLASFGLDKLRIEIVLTESGEKVRECGLSADACAVWGKYPCGALSIVLSFAKGLKVGCPQVVDVVMRIATQRLRVLPGRRHFEDVEMSEFVAEDPVTQGLLSNLRDLSRLDGTGANQKLKHILLEGERGTGKELLARAIHGWSGRSAGSFCAVNLGAVTKELATAEIFGSKKGAFTGSVADRRGYIEMAEGGTLFLDELDEANENTQALLKRVVQFGTFNTVGSSDEQKCDVRFVAATNRVSVEEDVIKLDLRDRFLVVRVPALRERKRDIRPLAERCARLNKYSLPESVCVYLESLEWPGNVRQLETVVERVCALAKSEDDITLEAFEASVRESGGNPETVEISDSGIVPLRVGETLKDRLNIVSKHVITEVMAACGGNKTHAADRLGMVRQNLNRLIKDLEIVEVVKR